MSPTSHLSHLDSITEYSLAEKKGIDKLILQDADPCKRIIIFHFHDPHTDDTIEKTFLFLERSIEFCSIMRSEHVEHFLQRHVKHALPG
ncbi:hypothetical protein CEXT_114451 [Caerostris extrusa]|uniref:Uncharacterized protein n=1 Tax=Caerostris extrusa TaxID=172846 RepID=A0AAV4R961_CAEEX|nr:hypothetical protein CEXT_114451 [Caerostris extrusa]